MDRMDFLTQEHLLRFFHCKKTEMSCIEKPDTFLNQLRDHNLVSEDLYEKVIRTKRKLQKEKGLYQVLDTLETKKPDRIKLFWQCMSKDHILTLYPVMRLLRDSLLDESFQFAEDLPEKEATSEGSKEQAGKKKAKVKNSVKKKGEKRSESVEEEEEEPGPSTQSTPHKRKRQQKPSYSSPIRKGVKEDFWTWPLYKATLPITCGDKEGSLHRDKLAKGEECILAEGSWFTPSAFAELGGKKNCKNWKTSIRCRDTTLQKLIMEGHLKCPRFFSRRSSTSPSKQRRTNSSHPRQPVQISDSDSDFEEDEGERGEDNKAKEQVDGPEEECQGDGGPEFLSVTCGSATGKLQKDRFASGTSGKCIRTASKWLTPVEFAQDSEIFWKKSILCQGVPISDLIERRVLTPHSLLCDCKLCSKKETDLKDLENDDYCSVCDQRGSLLCCDRCPLAFHSDCHLPTVNEDSLGEQWLCTYCVLEECQGWRIARDWSREQALESSISHFVLECQYLLLRLYTSDKHRIFSTDPCTTVPSYRDFIESPMWLDKVAKKLDDRQYSSVGQFVSDVQLIFKNSTTFNRDNEFGQMGAGLKQLFEDEFQRAFRVKN